MYILGISAFYHDAAAALIKDGEIIAAAEEERFTRIKHDAAFPLHAISWCLEYANIDGSDIGTVVFYDKPLLKFERLLETYYTVAPKGFFSFIKSIPVWVNEKLFLKRLIYKKLKNIKGYSKKHTRLLFTEHHLSHAASAFYPSSYEKAAIITIDGVGEWATTSISFGEGATIKVLKEIHFPDSVGLLYSAFTYYLGFKVNSGEYKLMGLAPYGDALSENTKRYIKIIKEQLCTVYEDGSISLNKSIFSFTYSLRMVRKSQMEKLFGFPKRRPEAPIEQFHCDLALAIQLVTEEIVFKLALHARQLTGCDNLCLAGGVALNSVANGKLQSLKIFKNIFIQPAAGDSGGALGAALAGYYLFYNRTRVISYQLDGMKGALLGPCFNSETIASCLKNLGAVYTKYEDIDGIMALTAQLLAEGNVVGWFQGRMEFGPRALGNRSILADPRNEEMQKKLNLKVKYREGFRPFAPSVLVEDSLSYFQLESESPYMLLVKPVASDIVNEPPLNYQGLSIWEKLYYKRSSLPAITHVDYSARVQTVSADINPHFYQLLKEFKKITGIPVLVNTSFNVRGEPMVCSPEDAYYCLMKTEMDVLVIDHYIIFRNQQAALKTIPNIHSFNYD